jgi:hypothetical protein
LATIVSWPTYAAMFSLISGDRLRVADIEFVIAAPARPSASRRSASAPQAALTHGLAIEPQPGARPGLERVVLPARGIRATGKRQRVD